MKAGWLVAAWLLVACSSRQPAQDVPAFGAALDELTGRVIAINAPLAEQFAAGAVPSAAEVGEAQADLAAVQAALAALGRPPAQQAAAYRSLAEAMDSFAAAYAHLAANLDAGIASPFDPEFLSLARHAGEAIHKTSAALTP